MAKEAQDITKKREELTANCTIDDEITWAILADFRAASGSTSKTHPNIYI